MKVAVIGPDDPSWDVRLQDVARDVYHLAGYHCLERRRGIGEPQLAIVDNGRARLAWPYLLRPLEIGGVATDVTDVTSAYGYAGPLAWGAVDDDFLCAAWGQLQQVWAQQRAVSLFTRFHPLLDNSRLCLALPSPTAGQGGPDGVRDVGETVSIDCTLPDEQVTSAYAKPLRQHLANAARIGYVTGEDDQWQDLDEFVRVYTESMDRNAAGDFYRFAAEDLAFLRKALPGQLHLLLTRKGDEVVAGGLFTESSGIVQAHLMGTASAHLPTSPGKALLDGAQRWARAQGHRVLHLGGGRGGRRDSLFRFKREFSRRRHTFSIGRWILDAPAYADLCRRRGFRDESLTGVDGYFPAYRAPLSSQVASLPPNEQPHAG
jgi:hypothetical protein